MDASEQLPIATTSEQKGEQNVSQDTPTSPGAASQSGQTRRALLTLGRGLSVLHRIVDRDADSGDFDDSGSMLDDDDAYSVSSMGSDNEDDLEEPEEDDVAMDDEEESLENTASQQHAGSLPSSGAGVAPPMPLLAAGALGPAGAARDPNNAKTRFVPERPAPNANPAQSSTAKAPVSQQPKTADGPQTPTAASVQGASISTDPPSTQSAPPAQSTTSAAPKKTTPPASAKPDPLAPTEAAPYGYKIVKVKKADGTIAKVKRPLKEGETYTPPKATAPPAKTRESSNDPNTPKDGATTHEISPVSTPVASSPQRTKTKTEITVTEKEIAQDEKSEISKPKTPTVTHRTWNAVQIASWLVMIIFPSFFLALAIWAAVEDQKLVPDIPSVFSSSRGNGFSSLTNDPLTQAKTTAVSLWPIVFAAVVASTLKAYAAFKVEQGISLVTLEQLISSHSVGAAIKQPFLLRKFNWATIILFIMWCLSPLAGQGIQRMLTTSQAVVTTEGKQVRYFSPHQVQKEHMILTFPFNDTELRLPNEFPRLETIYSSLQLGSISAQSSNQDIWGNIKIPAYAGPLNSTEPWSLDDKYELTSLLGIPWTNTDPKATSDGGLVVFNISSTYITTDCSAFVSHNLTSPAMMALNFSVSPSKTLYLSVENDTSVRYPIDSLAYSSMLNETHIPYPNSTNTTSDQFFPYPAPGVDGVFHLGSLHRGFGTNDSDGNFVEYPSPFGTDGAFDANKASIWYSKCSYKQVMVTSEAVCQGNVDSHSTGTSCFVAQQTLNRTASKDDFRPIQPLFVKAMLSMNGQDVGDKSDNWEYTDTEQFLLSPDFATNFSGAFSMDQLKPHEISSRFGLLVNTLWLAGVNFEPYLGVNGSQYHNTSATFEDFSQLQYDIHWPWFAVVIVCSSLLIIAGIASAAFELRTIGPDFLGFANTSMKRSVKLPKDMSTMNARDRLAALQECEVLLQDVRPNAQRGKIALGVKEQTSTRLIPGRDYV